MQRKLISSAICSLAAGMLLVAGSGIASATPVQWWDGFGANGHYYEIRGTTQANALGSATITNATWAAAQAAAAANATLPGWRASLVTITSAAEQAFVAGTLGGFIPTGGAWIGLSDSATEGTYAWVPVTVGLGTTTVTEPTVYTNWAAGQPSAGTAAEDFIRIGNSGGEGNFWFDQIDGSRHFIYEWSPIPEPGSMVLCGLGALAMAGYGWRRRRNRAEAAA
jgi:hypothetical protein